MMILVEVDVAQPNGPDDGIGYIDVGVGVASIVIDVVRQLHFVIQEGGGIEGDVNRLVAVGVAVAEARLHIETVGAENVLSVDLIRVLVERSMLLGVAKWRNWGKGVL